MTEYHDHERQEHLIHRPRVIEPGAAERLAPRAEFTWQHDLLLKLLSGPPMTKLGALTKAPTRLPPST